MNTNPIQREKRKKTSLYLAESTSAALREMAIQLGKPQSWIMEQAVEFYKNSLQSESPKSPKASKK